MSLALQSAWRHDGSPFILCTPGADFTATMQAHGFTVYSYPDQSHQVATPAEDHCPYSETPWPGNQPYPHGMATDLMPLAGGVSLATIGARILADKRAGHPGLAGLKYMNWTDAAGNCWHESWQPNYRRTSSSDRGHLHMSYRTDYVTSHVMAGYDPLGDDMANIPQDQWDALQYRVAAVFQDTATATGGPYPGEVNELHAHLEAIDAELAELKAAIAALQPGGGGNVNFPAYKVTFTGTGTSTPA